MLVLGLSFLFVFTAGELGRFAGETFREPADLGEVDCECSVGKLFTLDAVRTQRFGVPTSAGGVIATLVRQASVGSVRALTVLRSCRWRK